MPSTIYTAKLIQTFAGSYWQLTLLATDGEGCLGVCTGRDSDLRLLQRKPYKIVARSQCALVYDARPGTFVWVSAVVVATAAAPWRPAGASEKLTGPASLQSESYIRGRVIFLLV